MFELKMLAPPLIGAVIGYFTNWIAVKMLFRPRYPKHILGHRLPFTPGIIPRGKERLAKALGQVAGEQLFDRATMKTLLLSDKVKSGISGEVEACIEKFAKEDASLRDLLYRLAGEEVIQNEVKKAESYVSDRIQQNILSMNIGKVAAQKIADIILERFQGGMLSMLVNDRMIHSIKDQFSDGISKYVTQNIGAVTDAIVKKECATLLEKPAGAYGNLIVGSGTAIRTLVMAAYENLIEERLDSILEIINVEGIVKDRVNSMSVEEVETLTLSVMKNELGAVVNLGALIGFVLGLFNMFFYS